MVALTQSTTPGAWQSIVNANPGATEFVIDAGISREQEITLTSSNTGAIFTFSDGADVRGSRVMSSWSGSGPWTHSFTSGYSVGGWSCEAEFPMCVRRDHLFRDGLPLRQVPTTDQLDFYTYHIDYGTNTITVTFNPSGYLMEMSVSSQFLRPVTTAADDVHVRGAGFVRYYTPPQQSCAIQMNSGAVISDGWRVYDGLEVSWNCMGGIAMASRQGRNGAIVEDVVCSHNAQLNMKSGAGTALTPSEGLIVRRSNISYGNEWKGVSTGWEAGGTKFVFTKDMHFCHNEMNGSVGPQLWYDIDNLNPQIYRNKFYNAGQEAVKMEIGYGGLIEHNLARRCALRSFGRNGDGVFWWWGAAIHNQNTTRLEVRYNTIEDCGRGIVATMQARGTGAFGKRIPAHFNAHHNKIYAIPRRGGAGIPVLLCAVGSDDTSEEQTKLFDGTYPMRFEDNEYFMDTPYFGWNGNGSLSFASWQAAGHDLNATMSGRY